MGRTKDELVELHLETSKRKDKEINKLLNEIEKLNQEIARLKASNKYKTKIWNLKSENNEKKFLEIAKAKKH